MQQRKASEQLSCVQPQEMVDDGTLEGVGVRLGGRDALTLGAGASADLALWDGVLSIEDTGADAADIIVSNGASQVRPL